MLRRRLWFVCRMWAAPTRLREVVTDFAQMGLRRCGAATFGNRALPRCHATTRAAHHATQIAPRCDAREARSRQQGCDPIRLVVAVLQQQPSLGCEVGVRALDDVADRAEPVGTP